MTMPMYTGFAAYLGGCNGCNEGVTCLRTQRLLLRFVPPPADTLLLPDSVHIMLRSVLIRRQRVEFSREFGSLVRLKSGFRGSKRSNSPENLVQSNTLSVLMLVSSMDYVRSRIERHGVAKLRREMLHPCYTRYTL